MLPVLIPVFTPALPSNPSPLPAPKSKVYSAQRVCAAAQGARGLRGDAWLRPQDMLSRRFRLLLDGTQGVYILNTIFICFAEVPNCQSSYLQGGVFPSSHDGECAPGLLSLLGQADPPPRGLYCCLAHQKHPGEHACKQHWHCTKNRAGAMLLPALARARQHCAA